MKLREEAKKILLSNKIWGSVVGILPAVDWALQKLELISNLLKNKLLQVVQEWLLKVVHILVEEQL